MGQYHNPVAISAREWIKTYTIDGGAKLLEQALSINPRAALAILLATPEGDAARDGRWSPMTGRWAGESMAMVGDYAEADDLTPPLCAQDETEIYDSLQETSKTVGAIRRKNTAFHDIAHGLLPTLEILLGVRFTNGKDLANNVKSDDYKRNISVPVTHSDGSWALHRSGDPLSEDYVFETRMWENMLKGINEAEWRRDPLPLGAARKGCAAPAAEALFTHHGVGRLWVNLDRQEYIDPHLLDIALQDPEECAQDHDTSDLLDIAVGKSAGAIMLMLAHHVARGSGDGAETPGLDIRGRWRGDRIALTGPDGARKIGMKPAIPGVSAVRREWRDVTWAAIAAMMICDSDRMEKMDDDNQTCLSKTSFEALAILVRDATVRQAIQSVIDGDKRSLTITMTPSGEFPLRDIVRQASGATEMHAALPDHLKTTAQILVEFGEGRIRLNPSVEASISRWIDDQEGQRPAAWFPARNSDTEPGKTTRWTIDLSRSAVICIYRDTMSAHALMTLAALIVNPGGGADQDVQDAA